MSDNDIVLTDKQRKREISFNLSLGNKRYKVSNTSSNSNTSDNNNDSISHIGGSGINSSSVSLKNKYLQLKRKQIDRDNNNNNNNNIKLSDKQLKKKNKRKWRRSIPKSNQCCLFIKKNKKRCKNKVESYTNYVYCSKHIYLDPSFKAFSSVTSTSTLNDNDVFIQCKGSTKHSVQCLRAVKKEIVFCKQHLTPFYKSYLLQLKEKGLSLDEIFNHDAWKWNITTKKSKDNSIKVLEFNEFIKEQNNNNNNNNSDNINNNIETKENDPKNDLVDLESSYSSLEFINNSQKRLNQLRKDRISKQKESNQVKQQTKTKVKKKKKLHPSKNLKSSSPPSLVTEKDTKKIEKEDISTFTENKIQFQKSQKEFEKELEKVSKQPTPTNNSNSNNGNLIQETTKINSTTTTNIANNQNIFFGKVSNLLDDLGWQDDDDNDDEDN